MLRSVLSWQRMFLCVVDCHFLPAFFHERHDLGYPSMIVTSHAVYSAEFLSRTCGKRKLGQTQTAATQYGGNSNCGKPNYGRRND
jgi:hypothetical protein